MFVTVAAILSVVLLFGGILGLINPRWVKLPNRKQAMPALILSLILAVLTAPEQPGETPQAVVEADQAVATMAQTTIGDKGSPSTGPVRLTAEHSVTGTTLTVAGTTNVPDGTRIVIQVVSTQPIDVKESRDIVVSSGQFSHSFDLSDWTPQEIAYNVIIPFSWVGFEQAEEAKVVFGEKGELLTGDLVKDGVDGGKNVSLARTLLFPSKSAVEQHRQRRIEAAGREFISTLLKEDWIIRAEWKQSNKPYGRLDIYVTDAWYYTAKFQRERLAKELGDLLAQWRISLGVAENRAEDYPTVRIFDRAGKQVAGASTWGVRLYD